MIKASSKFMQGLLPRVYENKIIRSFSIFLLVVFVISVIFTATIVTYISQTYNNKIYSSASQIAIQPTAIIFGARVYEDGSLSPLLADRVNGGVELYNKQKAKRLLMTGDNSKPHNGETDAMKDYAIKLGVPESDILLDYAGFDTYDSCYRAKEVFGINNAILVTQRYHVARALFICDSLGISVDGYGLEDFSKYPGLRFTYSLREYVASAKAWYDVVIAERPAKSTN